MTSIYHYKTAGIDGEEIRFEAFKGKKILIVNVASACGFTPQYAQLQELYAEMHDKLVIIGFPSNDFGGQEPGSDREIQSFCQIRYGVTFPLAAKCSVVGNDKHPVYQWLTQKALNKKQDSEVRWNFQKYLLNESGELTHVFSSSSDPFSDEVLTALGLL